MPITYFEEVEYSDIDEAYSDVSIAETNTSIALTLPQELLPAEAESASFHLNYIFGDRRNYIDCQHPGSSDQYFLELSFELFHLTDDVYFILEFDWNEIYAAGHL